MLQTIKTLREKSGAGMVACKKALEESGNDIEKALEFLRKQGIAKAASRDDRKTCEGVIKLAVNDTSKKGYILKINSETDFVAKNDKFQNFAQKVLDLAQAKEAANLEELLNLEMEDSYNVQENLDSLSGIIGEKLVISEYDFMESAGTVASYSHAGGKIGALVAIDKEGKDSLAQDIAMHVAAANPKYLDSQDVPQEEINKEKDIFRDQLKKEGKPENIIDKILTGKINKYFEEICLVKQEFIKEDKKKIEDILEGAKIERFVRYSL